MTEHHLAPAVDRRPATPEPAGPHPTAPPVPVHWVAYGTEAATALAAEIGRAKGDEPLAPVTVVVPSNQVGVAARRHLGSGRLGPVGGAGPGLVNVTFLTPYRLAELAGAGALAGAGRRPVSTPVLTAAMRAALAGEPGLFTPVAAHPATEAALVSAYRELRDLSRAALETLVRDGSRRAAEVVRLHRVARARLEPDWYDEEDLMEAAAGAVERGTVADLGAVVVYLPQRLSGHAGRLLQAVAARHPVTAVAGIVGDARADAEVVASVRLLGAEPAAPPAEAVAAPPPVSPVATRIVTTSDADEEVRDAVRVVVEAVRGGVALDRIALVHGTADPYRRLTLEQLAAAGIPANGTAEVPVAARLAGRTLLGLLDLPATGFRRSEVFAWLTAAPVLHRGRFAPAAAWDRLSREAGVVGGRHDWDQRLASLADRLDADAEAADADPEEPDGKTKRLRSDATRARDLRRFTLDLMDRLDEASPPQRWPAHSEWARRLLVDLLGGPGRRRHWPAVEAKAAERVELALDRLGALDTVEGPVPVEVFARTLAVELEADLGRVGRFGEGVLVGSVAMAAGVDLDLVVVLGLAEGTFPPAVGEDSLLADPDRNLTGGELAPRPAWIDRLHREFRAVLAGASRHVLCAPRGDLRRRANRVPSRWLLDGATVLAGQRCWSDDLFATTAPWIHHVASFDAGLRRLSFPATGQEHRLRALLAEGVAPHRPTGGMPPPDPILAAGLEALKARRSDRLTRFDGNLAGLTVPSPVDRGTSATALERWAKCPHAYFMQHVLGVRPIEEPEEQLQISPLERGSLVHAVLESFVTEVLARPAGQQPGPDEPWSADDIARMEQIAGELCDDYESRGVTGRPLFWRQDRRHLHNELRQFLECDTEERRQHRSRPVAAELAFGFDGTDPVRFPLADGRTVPVRGKADRVDVAVDGTLRVLDYKTGKPDDYKKLCAEDPHQCGTRLQLAVYAQAARAQAGTPDAPAEAHYWFVSTRGGFKRHGYTVDGKVLDLVRHAMTTIVTGIEGGRFPPHPEAPTTSPLIDCEFCDPDGLGTAELRRQWERKVGDPGLAAYAELLEGICPDDDPGEDQP